MADTKKYLDLEGLSYFSEKIDDKYIDKNKYVINDEIDEMFKNFEGNISETDHYEFKVENDKVILINKDTLEEYNLPLDFSKEFELLDDKVENNLTANRITPLFDSTIGNGIVVETIGTPKFISSENFSNYAQYNINTEGWYSFIRIHSKKNIVITDNFSISGTNTYIVPKKGSNYVDVAVDFGVTAESKIIVINWGEEQETFVFKATDLAIRNLDYRVTFYLYDIADYTEWEYALTTDETFVNNKKYYIKNGNNYELATVTPEETVAENTYYNHSKVIFKNFTKNVSYCCDYIDCPIEIYLPEVDDENYGAWFEIQTELDTARSITIIPSDNTKVSGTGVANPKAGINIINFQFHKPTKTWLPTVTNWALSQNT